MRTPGRERPAPGARIGLVLLGLVAGGIAGEVLSRCVGFEFRPHMRNRVYFAEPHPLLGWRNRPGLAGPYGGDEFSTFVTINADGQRGPSHPVERVPGKRRIAVLGDSQTWGDGVGDDETFVARLDGGDTEVLSFATPGWGTDQEILVLDAEAARWRPDVVVLAFFLGNDLDDNLRRGSFQYPKPWFTVGADGALELQGVPVPYSRAWHAMVDAYRAVMRHSAVLNAIAELSRRGWSAPDDDTDGARGGKPDGKRPPYNNPMYAARLGDRERFAFTGRLLLEFVRRVRAMDATPVVLMIPELWQVEVFGDPQRRAALWEVGGSLQRPQRWFTGLLEAQDVQVIDALPALARATRTSRARGGPHTYYPEWRHLNAFGHAVIADLLRARLDVGRRRSARLQPLVAGAAEEDLRRRPGPAASGGAAGAEPHRPPPAPESRSGTSSPSRDGGPPSTPSP